MGGCDRVAVGERPILTIFLKPTSISLVPELKRRQSSWGKELSCSSLMWQNVIGLGATLPPHVRHHDWYARKTGPQISVLPLNSSRTLALLLKLSTSAFHHLQNGDNSTYFMGLSRADKEYEKLAQLSASRGANECPLPFPQRVFLGWMNESKLTWKVHNITQIQKLSWRH